MLVRVAGKVAGTLEQHETDTSGISGRDFCMFVTSGMLSKPTKYGDLLFFSRVSFSSEALSIG